MKQTLLLLALMLTSSVASAGTISFNEPVQTVDGTPVPAGTSVSYKAYYSQTSGFACPSTSFYDLGAFVTDGLRVNTTFDDSNLAAGVWYFKVTAVSATTTESACASSATATKSAPPVPTVRMGVVSGTGVSF